MTAVSTSAGPPDTPEQPSTAARTGSARLPEVPDPPRADPKDPAWCAVTAHLVTHTRALLRNEDRVRAGAEDSVHQMRVAARRLRSGLRAFRPLLDEDWARCLGDELAWAADGLSAARDREVLLARLDRDLDRLPDRVPAASSRALVRAALAPALDEAHAEALATLDSPRYVALVELLVQATHEPRTTATADARARSALPPLVAAAYRRLYRYAERLPVDPPGVTITEGSDAAWHETRIQAKKARYAAEACVPVFGRRAADLAGQLARVTEILGEHQDAAIAAETAVVLGSSPGTTPSAALGLGVLHGVERQAVRAARAQFAETWPEVSHKRWRTWL